jgi:hypothetical protein
MVNGQQRELEEDSAEEARHTGHPMVIEYKQDLRHASSGNKINSHKK